MPQHDNLARKIDAVAPVQNPSVVSSPETAPLHIEKSTPKKGLTRPEKIIISLFVFLTAGMSMLNVAAGNRVNTLNQAQQDAKRSIETAQIWNTNLEQQIQELTRYDRIYRIAEEKGLEVNEQNVRDVAK